MQQSNETNRRGVLALAAGAAALAATGPARAASTAQATALVQRVTDEVTSIMNSGRSEGAILQAFEGVFSKYADTNIIAQTLMGVAWRSASGGQRSAFTTAVRGYLSRKYGKQFRDYQNADVAVTGAVDRGSKGIIVNSVVKAPRQAPFTVDWQVSDRSGSLKFVNLFIEGISMLATERAEVQGLLERARGNIDTLIAELNRRG